MVAIVSEMTGYPLDLLDVDLDLEADLGVDTVKQAEVFAAIREAYGVARDDALKLRDFPTLTHVVGWIRGNTGAPAPATVRRRRGRIPGGGGSPVMRTARGRNRGRVDRLSAGPARRGSRPRGRSRGRHRQAGRGVRGDPPAYGVARDATLKLRDFPTLTHVVGWIRDRIEATTGPKARSRTPPLRHLTQWR